MEDTAPIEKPTISLEVKVWSDGKQKKKHIT